MLTALHHSKRFSGHCWEPADADGFAPVAHLVFGGAGRQQDLLSVKELRQRLGDGSSALVGHLVHQGRGPVHRILLLGEKSRAIFF